MSVEENKALVRRLFEAWNTGNLARALAVFRVSAFGAVWEAEFSV